MAQYCSDECKDIGPVCDFCRHYDFNGDGNGAYTGDGRCNLHGEYHDPWFGCEDFICFRIGVAE